MANKRLKSSYKKKIPSNKNLFFTGGLSYNMPINSYAGNYTQFKPGQFNFKTDFNPQLKTPDFGTNLGDNPFNLEMLKQTPSNFKGSNIDVGGAISGTLQGIQGGIEIAKDISDQSKLEDTSSIEAQINQLKSTKYGGSSADELLQQWYNTPKVNNVTLEDLYGYDPFSMEGMNKAGLQSTKNMLNGFSSGAAAGGIFGPVGNLIGGAIGAIGSSFAGAIADNRKLKKAEEGVKTYNEQIAEANKRNVLNFNTAIDSLESSKQMQDAASFYDYGGPLFNRFDDGGSKNENTDLDVSIPKDRPKSVKKNFKFLQNWANSPYTQKLWKQNEIDTSAFEDQKALASTNRRIKDIEEVIEWNKKNSENYDETNDKRKLELNKLYSEELTSNIDVAKNKASQKSIDEIRSDMTSRLQSSFEAPLHIYEDYKEWGTKNMTEKEKKDYEKLKQSAVTGFKENPDTGGLGGFDSKTGATIASYRNEDVLKANPLHEFLHPGWSGTETTMSAPALKMEQILREEGLYEDDYWDSGNEGYSRFMDFRLFNNIDPNDRKWTEERVNTELKNKGYKMLDRYGAKIISRLLNEVAYNNPSNLDIEVPEQMKYTNSEEEVFMAAEGGPLFREFNNGVTTINEGDTHENNPNEGIQVGIDPEGIPNLVEEGEVIFNDYVFSNRLIVPNKVRTKYKLKNNKDLSFADAAKDITKMSEEMPNDPIVKRTMELRINQLIQEQEMVRQKKNKNKSNKFDVGGWTEYITPAMDVITSEISAFQKPDYSHLTPFENAIKAVNNKVSVSPVTTNLPYKPTDTNPILNRLQANQAANRRAIMNTSQGNPAIARAMLLANDYTYNNQLGDLWKQAEEADYKRQLEYENFRTGLEANNQARALQAATTNAQIANNQAQLWGTYADKKQAIDALTSASVSSNLNAAKESMAGLARQGTYEGWLDKLISNNVLQGFSEDKKSEKKSKGGKIKRRRRLS